MKKQNKANSLLDLAKQRDWIRHRSAGNLWLFLLAGAGASATLQRKTARAKAASVEDSRWPFQKQLVLAVQRGYHWAKGCCRPALFGYACPCVSQKEQKMSRALWLSSLSLLLCFACYSAGLQAQQNPLLQLYVVDATTNEALPFVNIQVFPSKKGGSTDEKGKLDLQVPLGELEIRATFVGYADFVKTLRVQRDIKYDIALIPEGTTLGTVTVSGSDLREQLERPTMGLEQLTAKELRSIPLILGEADVLKGLQLSSGVNSAGEASNGLSIRGGTIDQNLVLLDGAPVFTPTHLFGLFSVFTPDALGSVNLYRANIPARYGGRVASVIDVRSRTPSSDSLALQGGIGLVSTHLALETPISKDGKWKMLIAGRGGFNDFLFSLVQRLKETRSSFADGTLKIRFTASDNSIFTLSAFGSYDFYQINLLNRFGNINSEVNQYRYKTLNGSLEWLRILNDRSNWQTRLVRANYQPDLIFPETVSEADVTFGARVLWLSAQSDISLRAGSHQLLGGLQAAQYRLSPGTLDPDGSLAVNPLSLAEEQGLELSLFAEDEWLVNEKLSLSAGLRYTQYLQLGPGEERIYQLGEEVSRSSLVSSRAVGAGELMATYGGLEPRLGLSYKIGERSSFKAAWAVSRQYLQNIYNATSPLPTSRWKVADAFVRPQKASFYSAGLYQISKSGFYNFSVEAYYRRTDNILEYKPGADFFLEPLVETQLLQGQAEAWGIELSAEKKVGRLSGQVNYTYARSFNQVTGLTFQTSINEGNPYPGYFDQPHTMNAILVLDRGRTHELGFNLVVQTNRPYTVPNGFFELNDLPVPLFFERNNARLPTYHRLDFSWTIHNFRREKRRFVADWVFTVYNLYGRNNAYNIYFQPKEPSQRLGILSRSPFAAYRLSIFAAPVLSLSYKFTFQ